MARIGLKGEYYNTAEEQEKFPIGCFPLPDVASLEDAHCFLCGAGSSEVKLGYTDCCNAVACANEHEYELMSYSRDHCRRSHSKYTRCGQHKGENHEGDWRECQQCADMYPAEGGSRKFSLTNGFNMTPAPESCLPKGSMLTYKCSGCPRRILDGYDSTTTNSGGIFCMSCKPIE